MPPRKRLGAKKTCSGCLEAIRVLQTFLDAGLRRDEAASRPEDRFLAVDGSDLVYRMFLNREDGYHSDAELASMLPAVLAGLPETIDTTGSIRRRAAAYARASRMITCGCPTLSARTWR
jgi:hypothetical protein